MMKVKHLFYVIPTLAILLTGCAVQTWEPVPSLTANPIEGLSPEPTASVTFIPSAQAEPFPQKPEENYFDNALFVGDSIMEGIRRYTVVQRQEGEALGRAQFLTCSTGIALADLVGDWERNIQFSYQGTEQPLERIVAEIKPQRVFLLLGMNDIAGAEGPVSDIIDRYSRLIYSLQETRPGMELIVITSTPKTSSQWLPEYLPNRHFGNELIGEYAAALVEMCKEMEIPCIDLYTALKDEHGALPDVYCLDGYVHLNDAGAATVVEILNDFAATR